MNDETPAAPRPEAFDKKQIKANCFGLSALAAASFVVLLAGLILNLDQFAFSYLFAFAFFFTLCAGALFWIVVHHLTNAEWSVVARRQMENVAGLFSILAVFFVPLIFLAPHLWTWLQFGPRTAYFNPPFFWLRTAVYFIVFILSAHLLRRFSVAQDERPLMTYTRIHRRVAAASAIPLALCLTFASIDWLMDLEVPWASTAWGFYIFAGSALSFLCLLVLILAGLRAAGHLAGIVTTEHFAILGKLIFAFTIFWAYIAFSQYLLIWYANLPAETVYFSRRTHGTWLILSAVLAIGHFALPFLLLLPRAAKRNVRLLCFVAGWLLLMHALDLYLIVLPALHPGGAEFSFLDPMALFAFGTTLGAIFLQRLGRSSLYPTGDPRLPESITLKA